MYLISLVRSKRKKEQGSQGESTTGSLLIMLVIGCLDTRQHLSKQASFLCLLDFDRMEEESSSLTRQKKANAQCLGSVCASSVPAGWDHVDYGVPIPSPSHASV